MALDLNITLTWKIIMLTLHVYVHAYKYCLKNKNTYTSFNHLPQIESSIVISLHIFFIKIYNE